MHTYMHSKWVWYTGLSYSHPNVFDLVSYADAAITLFNVTVIWSIVLTFSYKRVLCSRSPHLIKCVLKFNSVLVRLLERNLYCIAVQDQFKWGEQPSFTIFLLLLLFFTLSWHKDTVKCVQFNYYGSSGHVLLLWLIYNAPASKMKPL